MRIRIAPQSSLVSEACLSSLTVPMPAFLLPVLALMVLTLFLMICRSGCCQSSPEPASSASVDAASTIRVSSRLVILDALVENKKTGALIGGLQAADFRLSEDGIPQTITYFSQDRLPLSVVFLFDLTDTVRPALQPLAEGAKEILGHLKPKDEVAVMVFSSHTDLLQDFTTDRALAAAAIEKAPTLKTKDGTFIHESMFEAVHQAMQSTTPGSRRIMIWLTDGSANSQNSMTRGMIGQGTLGHGALAQLHTKEQATDVLLHSGVVVSALIERTADTDMAIVNPFMRIVGVHMGDIRRYAELTGGPVLNTSKKDVAAHLAELVDQIRLRYTLGYRPSATRPDGTFCRLQLQLNAQALKGRVHPSSADLASADLPSADLSSADLSKVIVHTREGYYR